MATNIFLGMPPPKIKEWIEKNYKPAEPENPMLKVPLHFTAEQDGSSVSLVCEDSMEGEFIDSWCEFEYSMTGKDDDWKTYETGSDIPLNKDETVYFRCPREKDDPLNQNKNGLCQGEDYGGGYFELYKSHFFKMEGSIKADGNIQFLIDKTGTIDYVPVACYDSMFRGCTSLTQAPVLPAKILDSYCYQGMFSDCSLLIQAPALPAETMADGCYTTMFSGCTNLTQAPALPATTLAIYCYNSMFSGCTNLTQAPELPAETLATGCYTYMFEGCTSLTQAPELPAETLSDGCYKYMFSECTSLIQAPELSAETLANNCYYGMFEGCSSLPEPKYDMSHMTFDEVTNEIQNTYIFGEDYYGDPIQVQCSDKILVATFDDYNYEWTITEG